MRQIPFPPAPYIPGKTARHPEDWFNPLKQDPETAMRAGLAYFDAGFYWECHELLEAIWLGADDPSPERKMAQAIIQLANARLKMLMDRPKAAARLCDMVADLLDDMAPGTRPLGQDPASWRARLNATRL